MSSNNSSSFFMNQCSRRYSMFVRNNLASLLIHPWRRTQQLEKLKHNLSLLKLSKTSRYYSTVIDLFGSKFELVDSESFLYTYVELFENQIYKFSSSNKSPLILDCGANIGLSIIYFKRLYPDSRIIAFEPDPNIFNVLRGNVESFKDVELINKAVWTSETTLEFMAEGSDGGRLVNIEQNAKKYQVSTVRLRDYLKEPIDMLKIDVEGAEIALLKDCVNSLHNVKNLFVEYHSFINGKQELNELIDILTNAGFRLYIQSTNSSPQPFMERKVYLGMDLLLNIFAFRDI